MSLNSAEIDLILSELHLEGARIQDAYQPTLQTLCLELYAREGVTRLHVHLERGAVRLHLSRARLPKPKKPQRFQQLLQSKLIGSRVLGVTHIDHNRIVRIETQSSGGSQSSQASGGCNYLYLKLWSGNANIIYTDEHNTIIDLLYRSAAQGLMPKQIFRLPEERENTARSVRAWEGFSSFNEAVDALYGTTARARRVADEAKEAAAVLQKRQLYLQDACANLEKRIVGAEASQTYAEYGNIILANAHRIAPGMREFFPDEGAEEPGAKSTIPLDARFSAAQNAEAYFEKARKEKRGLALFRERLAFLSEELSRVERMRSALADANLDPMPAPSKSPNEPASESSHGTIPVLDAETRAYVQQHSKRKTDASSASKNAQENFPGIALRKDAFLVYIGRNAEENDALLRKYARGEDMWLHVRGERGGFVFLRLPRQSSRADNGTLRAAAKSAPLDLLLECANLAALYSKVGDGAPTDVYCAKVKHLKRVKHAVGQVIPMNSKTLHVRADKTRARAFIANHSDTGKL